MNFAGQSLQTTGASRPELDKDALSLLDIRDFIARHWRFIGLVTLFAIALALAYLAIVPSRYTAQADMIIDTKRVTWTQSEFATENRMVEDASVESEIETTKSEKVALAVINRLRLYDDPEFIGSGTELKQRLFRLVGLDPPVRPQLSGDELTQNAMRAVIGNLRVARVGRSYIEKISFTSLDPQKAATVANAFADAYIEDQIQAKFEATRRASEWLQQRIGELRKQASDAYRAVQDFKSNNSIMVSDGKLASELELDQLGIALAKARAETSQARAKLERITRVIEQRKEKEDFEIPDPVVTDALSNPVITKLRQQYLDDQSKEAEWSSRYGANHQAAKNLRDEMANIRHAIWDEITRIAESYRSEVQIAKTQEDSIDKRMLDVFQKSAGTRQAQVHLRELETAANTYRGIYETFLSRFTQSVQQQSFPSTEARVVTLATPPIVRSSPKTNLTLALATLLGMAFGVMASLARDRMSRRIHTRAQIEQLLGTSCLAVIPFLGQRSPAPSAERGTSRFSRLVRPRFGKSESTRQALPPGKSQLAPAAFEKINEVAPFSATAEALRHIKVAIDLNPGGGRIIGIVSARPGEGKTTMCASFAAFLSKSGAKTLLIDGDLRNPSLSRTLGYKNKQGLLELVANQSPLKEVVITDPVYNFDFLPAATEMKPINSADVLNSPAVKRMLKSAAGTYDYVLVDLPPILPVVDVKAAAHLFDAFILVVEWGSTMSDEVRTAIGVSRILSERLLGAVLNKTDEDLMRRLEGYSYRAHHYYYYGEAGHDSRQTDK
jgi:exopolysaccharide transport family protein